MLGVDREEEVKAIRDFVAEKKLTYPIFQDPKREFYSKFTPQWIPWNVVLAPDRKILYTKEGFDEETLRKAVDEALKQLKK